jgi:uncharacterized protein YbjT (DUF2867 family)
MSDTRPVVAVIGATGSQGGSVVRALVDRATFRVRALTRVPAAYSGPADEVAAADLGDPASLRAAFAGAHGVFAVSNFWEPGTDEIAQGRNAVDAAIAAGVRHFVWSTLPNVEAISGGAFEVAHFTNKSRVDELVSGAGFEHHTFVEAPFYFENLVHNMPPSPLPDGRTGWALPLPPDAEVVHMGTIADLGGVVAGAFEHPETVGAGSYLSSAAELTSFANIVATLNAQGHSLAIVQVPAEVFASFFPGAHEMAQMMGYWETHTYLGPDADTAIAAARAVSTTASTDFVTWAAEHMPADTTPAAP